MKDHSKLIYPDLSYQVTGALFKTHNELGMFLKENQYGDCLEKHLKQAGLAYRRELILPPGFEGERPGRNKADFIIEDKIIVELKAKRVLAREDYYQVRRYLVLLNKKLAILVNFRRKYLSPIRIINSQYSGTY